MIPRTVVEPCKLNDTAQLGTSKEKGQHCCMIFELQRNGACSASADYFQERKLKHPASRTHLLTHCIGSANPCIQLIQFENKTETTAKLLRVTCELIGHKPQSLQLSEISQLSRDGTCKRKKRRLQRGTQRETSAWRSYSPTRRYDKIYVNRYLQRREPGKLSFSLLVAGHTPPELGKLSGLVQLHLGFNEIIGKSPRTDQALG